MQVALLLEAGANKALGDLQGTEPHQLAPLVRRGPHTPRRSSRVAALLEAEAGSSAASTAVGAPRPAHAMSGAIDFDSSGSDLSLNLSVAS